MTYKILTCPKCGDDDICRDATALWNARSNRWELAGTMDGFTCEACGEAFRTPNETDIDAAGFFTRNGLIDENLFVIIAIRPVKFDGENAAMCEPADAQSWGVYLRVGDDENDSSEDVHLVDKRTRSAAEEWARDNIFRYASEGAFVFETPTTSSGLVDFTE